MGPPGKTKLPFYLEQEGQWFRDRLQLLPAPQKGLDEVREDPVALGGGIEVNDLVWVAGLIRK